MSDLATLLGETKNVHFSHLEDGSTVLAVNEDDEALPEIDARLDRVRRHEGPSDAMEAVKRINRRLRDDNGTGILTELTGTEIIKFSGREQVELTFGAFNQPGSIDGIVIVIGGKGDPVPVHIQAVEDENRIYNCYSTREMAKALAAHIFGSEIRVYGTGRWLRDADCNWNLERFSITGFDQLNNETLTAVVGTLRAIKGSEWINLKDPWGELELLRNGPDEDQ